MTNFGFSWSQTNIFVCVVLSYFFLIYKIFINFLDFHVFLKFYLFSSLRDFIFTVFYYTFFIFFLQNTLILLSMVFPQLLYSKKHKNNSENFFIVWVQNAKIWWYIELKVSKIWWYIELNISCFLDILNSKYQKNLKNILHIELKVSKMQKFFQTLTCKSLNLVG